MKPDSWQRLRPLLDRAIELEGEARSQYLESLRIGDAALHAEVVRLLDEHEHLRQRSMPQAMELVAPVVAQSIQEDAALDHELVGQHIGPYRLVRLLGAGGMGSVYLAERSEDGFAHEVALKVVRGTFTTASARDRFERERQILASLRHPCIALLFDGGQTSDGQLFYTMEYVDGEEITKYCEHRLDSAAARVHVLLQIASALAYAHQNLVVHRDIKPSNVLVGADGRVKLLDFGLAKPLNGRIDPTMTQAGLAPMTPAYAAPEQFHNGPITVATDIYQFGVLCFCVLTGHLPYRADPNDSLNWAHAVSDDEPLVLTHALDLSGASARDAQGTRQLRRQLTRDLDAILRKALAKTPSARYRSMDAMIADLEAFLAGRPVSARRAGALYFTWRFVQRRRYVVAATALAMAVIGATGLIALRQARTAASQAERAERETEVRNVTRAMLTDLLRAGPASAHAKRPTSALEALDQGAERTLQALGSNPLHRAIATSVLAASYLDLGHPERARALLEQTLSTLDGRDDLHIDVLQLDLLLARAEIELGDVTNGEATLRRAEEMIATLSLPKQSPSRLAAALLRVQLADHAGHRSEAREAALSLMRENDKPGLNDTLEFVEVLRINARNASDYAGIVLLLERAWKIIAKHYGEDSPAALAAQRAAIGRDALGGLRRLDSDQLLEKQEAHLREVFGETSIDYAQALQVHCLTKFVVKQYASAETLCRQVVAILEQRPDSSASQLADAYDNEGDMLLHLGKPAEALPYFERELALRSREFAPTHQNVIHTRLQIAKAHCSSGKTDIAIHEFETAITDLVAQLGPLHPFEAIYAASFARCLLNAGLAESARDVLERHGRLEPPRAGMSEKDRTAVTAIWELLSH